MSEKIGVIAGHSQFPIVVVKALMKQGYEVTVAAIREEAFEEINELTENVHWIGLGQLGKLVRIFQREKIKKALMAGKVTHARIFSNVKPDLTFLNLLVRLKDKSTDSLIGAVAEFLAGKGIELVDSTAYIREFLPRKGIMTKRKPTGKERVDLEYGWQMAKAIADLDIGQTIIVKDRAVVAVEAMEGTDSVIQRGGRIGRGNVAVIKVSKPGQDMRFDVPVVGKKTIETMIEAGAGLLAIEAEKTIIFDQEDFLGLADSNGICILAK